LSGVRQTIGARLETRRGAWLFGGDLLAEDDDTDDPRFAVRWFEGTLDARWTTAGDAWTFGAQLAARRTTFETDFVEDRVLIAVELVRRLSPRARLCARHDFGHSAASDVMS
jgi:hypothetical protein